jgi:hypothetical protein
MLVIARTRLYRKVFQNKGSSFRLNKRPVEEAKINRFLKRKRISNDVLISMTGPPNGKISLAYCIHGSNAHHLAPSPAFSVYTPYAPTPDEGPATPLVSHSPTISPAPLEIPVLDFSYTTAFRGRITQQSRDPQAISPHPPDILPQTDNIFDPDSLDVANNPVGLNLNEPSALTHSERSLDGEEVKRKDIARSKPAQLPLNQSPRYLRQNDCDEELNIILDQVTPYYDESFSTGKWNVGADYLYDDFTQYVGQAIASFSRADNPGGGLALRQAFIKLEPLIRDQKLWGLERVFYAVSGLAASRHFDIVKSLLNHSRNLASAKFEWLHPMVQILKRFSILSDKDDAFLSYSVLTVWRLCHSVVNAKKANSILLFRCRKHFWRESRNLPAQHQTTRNLRLFLEQVEKDFGEYHNIALVIYDELLAIYSHFHCDEFEQTAQEMLRRTKRRLQDGKTSGELVSWYRNANYELAWFYYNNGKIERAIEHLQQVISDRTENLWESEQFELWQRWMTEAERPSNIALVVTKRAEEWEMFLNSTR